ncbi:MAG: hypothetical protein COA42_19525 [Alteromonadaceae bacterium]|nr:MAG: hypothetical protein COA42_19525 [Alteromonadaceae bacterium]
MSADDHSPKTPSQTAVTDAASLKKQLTKALPCNKHLHSAVQVQGYFGKAAQTIDLLQASAPSLPVEKILTLVDYAIKRLDKALRTIDDSGGYRFPIENTLKAMHIKCAGALPWEKSKLAKYLLDKMFGDDSDFYPEIPEDYAGALGSSGSDLFYLQLEKHWQSLPPYPVDGEWSEQYPYFRVQHVLAPYYKAKGEHDKLILMHHKTARTFADFERLCELCIELGELTQAEFWLNKLRRDDSDCDNSNPRILEIEVSLCVKQEQFNKALEGQWRLYCCEPTEYKMEVLLAIARRLEQYDAVRAKLQAYLEGMLSSPQNEGFTPKYSDALAGFYLYHERPEQALLVAQENRLTVSLLLKVARNNTQQPIAILPLFIRVAESVIGDKKKSSYKSAVKILEECAGFMHNLAHKAEYKKQLAVFRQTHKAKRNLMMYLDASSKIKALVA